MCEPATIATISTIASVASVGMSVVGAVQQSSAQKSQVKYQAAVARNNQIITARQAEDARERGKKEELSFRRQLSQMKGKQRSIFAGSGVVVDEGSALDTLTETAELGEIDALTIRNNAEREAYGHEVRGMNFQNEAQAADATAGNISPFFSGASTLLTSGTQAAFNLGYGKKAA